MEVVEVIKDIIWSLKVIGRHKKREEHVLETCGCSCKCPECGDILNDQAECNDDAEAQIVYYHCNTCGCDSEWTFDAAPCPILLSEHNLIEAE